MKGLTFWIAVCAAACGCALDRSPGTIGSATGHKSQREIQSIVKESIPIGTDVALAQSVLESEGFTCKLHEDATLSFKELRPDGTVVEGSIENVNYLDCSRARQQGLITSIDIVAVVFTEEGVSDIKTFKEFVGP